MENYELAIPEMKNRAFGLKSSADRNSRLYLITEKKSDNT